VLRGSRRDEGRPCDKFGARAARGVEQRAGEGLVGLSRTRSGTAGRKSVAERERQAEAACLGLRFCALVSVGKNNEAVSTSAEIIKLDPRSAWAHAVRAGLLARTGDFEKAVSEFKTTLVVIESEDNPELFPRVCHDLLTMSQALLKQLGKSNTPAYTDDVPSSRAGGTSQQPPMGEALTEDHFIALFRKVPEGKRGAVRDVLQAAAGETTERAPAGLRAASTRARRESRAVTAQQDWQPPSVRLPAGLQWPREQFEGSPEYQKTGGIVRHLDRVWKPLIAAGVIDMALLRNFYPSTARGIDRFKHNNGGEPRSLGDLDIRLLKAGSGRRRRVAALERA
jgi:hypothetical protein